MAPRPEIYERVLSTIEEHKGSNISVPALSKLLGVKTTTLNARFRRERVEVQTVGRTNYIPHELALRLAELHKYALFGWPTLQEASALTTVKDGTLKARCEKGKLQGFVDLTKRLRVNPADLARLQACRAGSISNGNRVSVQSGDRHCFVPKIRYQGPGPVENASAVPKPRPSNRARLEAKPSVAARRNGFQEQVTIPSRSRPIPAAPEPHIEFLTRKSYGLPETEEPRETTGPSARTHPELRKRLAGLEYLPDQPLSISECKVGKAIHYGPHDGTIIKLLDDPYAPRIQVNFPAHPEPTMREVQLVVGRRKIKP